MIDISNIKYTNVQTGAVRHIKITVLYIPYQVVRLWNCKGSWRGHFRITLTPPQHDFEPIHGTGHQVRVAFASYRAGLGGFSSLISDKPGTALPCLTLASTIYGMEVVRGGLAKLAHSVVCNMSLEVCRGCEKYWPYETEDRSIESDLRCCGQGRLMIFGVR